MKNKCFKEIEDFEEMVDSGDIKICFLHDPEFGYTDNNPKAPEGRTKRMLDECCFNYLVENGVTSFEELGESENAYRQSINGKFNYRTTKEANLPMNRNRNIGITFPNHLKNEFWVCLDIDGQDSGYMIESSKDLKIATRYYLFKCITHGLNKRGIKFLCSSTMNNGFHIYFKVTQSIFQDHGFNSFDYPQNAQLMSEVDPNILENYPLLHSILGQSVENGAIEVFTRKKYVVAPGSVIDNRKYRLLPDGVQRFQDVTVYKEKPVEELISDILTEDCFFRLKVDKPKEISKHNGLYADGSGFNITSEKQQLSSTNIKNMGDFIIDSFQSISGQKHYATLALGGFLYSQNIAEDSIVKLGEYIIDNAPPNMFKGSKESERTSGFLKVLVHDSNEDTEKRKTGLTTLKKIFEGTGVSIRDLTKILWINSAPQFHRFNPNGIDTVTYKEVRIDFENKETKLYSLKRSIDKESGEESIVKLNSQVINHVVTGINYIDDISSSQTFVREDMPISFYIQSRLTDDVLYIKDNTKEMIENYDSLPLAHAYGSKEIMSLVINEYESIGLIGTIERSKIPGIYLSRDGRTLRKFVYIGGQVVEEFPNAPNKEELTNALKLLKQTNDAYPWYDDKFATFVKLGMILPYGYVFKTEYRSFIRGIILYGEGGTCKSSASELIEYMNVPAESIKSKELEYILPGSEFSSVYRMGKALSQHSFPISIEEVENVFSEQENRDLIKNSISRKFIRNPGGEHEYYSRAIPVFSANELSDEIEKSGMFRRFLILNFVNGERGDKPEVEERLAFLNRNGVRNSRFEELYPIGQYVFHDLHNHLEYFAYTPQKIIDLILRDMEEYTDMDLSWLVEPKFDKYYQTDRSNEDQTDLSMVLDTLKYHFKNSIKLSGVASNVSEQFLENLIEDKYPYIYRIKSQKANGVLITSDFNKSYKKSYPDAKKMSLDRLVELFNDGLELKTEVSKSRMKPSGFKKRVVGVYMDWEDFCNIFNIKISSEEE